MSGGDLVRQDNIDKKWMILDGPYGTGFSAFPGVPTASPWSIMDRTDSEANSRDVGNVNKLKIMCFGRDAALEEVLVEVWGYHEDGPPDFLGELKWILGSVSAGVDATLLPADIAKYIPGLRSAIADDSNWYGADVVTVNTAGVYGAEIWNINNGIATKMNLANIVLDISGTGHSHLGVHMVAGATPAAAAFLMSIPVE